MHVFDLTHVALVLFLVLAGGLFLERLRQPALVGYLFMGAIIGPGLLGLQGDDATVRWLAELAIVLLMFMLGLELNLNFFRESIGKALGIALSLVLVSVSSMLGLTLLFDISLQTAVLFGFIAALSSTAVAMTMLRNLGEEHTEMGHTATAILIAQDILVVPMLLVVTILGEGFTVSGMVHVGLSLGVIAATLVGIFELALHPQWVARLETLFTRGASQPVVAAMALCFGAAALSGSIGLSTAYGAFAIGLLIGNMGTIGASYRSAVEPIHELLMMVFFLSIGLLLDIGFILTNLPLIGMLLGITVVLKTAFTVLIARIAGIHNEIALPLGAVLGQIGEFSFVLLALGLSTGFLTHETYQIGLSVIALSLVISPVWYSLVRHHLRTVHGIEHARA
jgi:CPA2 family monovalent cation:H+ antiporter-2